MAKTQTKRRITVERECLDTVPRATRGNSPFDVIRRTDERGEYWLARELMPLLGYAKWQKFEGVIGRVATSIGNTGLDPTDHVTGAANMVPIGSGAIRKAQDYRLSRHGCYLCAMNGDPRKAAIAAAQGYFSAIRSNGSAWTGCRTRHMSAS